MKIKKVWTRLLIAIAALSQMLCLGLNASAATLPDAPAAIATLSQDTIYVSDQDQTVLMNVKLEYPDTFAIFGFSTYCEGGITFTDIQNDDPDLTYVEGAHWLEGIGKLSFFFPTVKDFVTDQVATITYHVPAGTPAGTYKLGVEKFVSARQSGDIKVHDNENIYAILTILPAEDIEDPDVPLDPDPQPGDPDSPYTVTIVRNGEGMVHAGDTVTMNVTVSGGSFGGTAFHVNYNTNAFVFDEDSSSTASFVDSGDIYYNLMDENDFEDGSVVAVLVFTAKDVDQTTTGAFTLNGATADTYENAKNHNAKLAAVENASVTVTKQYTVTFMGRNGAVIGEPVLVDGGSKAPSVPEAPVVDNYTFDAWFDGTDTFTAAEILDRAVTGDVTYTAVYTAASYDVVLPEELEGAAAATFNEDYTVTIKDYDPDGYSYTVTYQVDNGEEKTAVDNGDGTFTIPGGDITGGVTVTLKQALGNITKEIWGEYVTGWTLVTVKTSDGQPTANGFCYDGHDMFYVEQYQAYAWLVEGELTEDELAEVTKGTGNCAVITQSYDVNMAGDGLIDFNDALAVFGCYKVVYQDVAADMALYLRADVNGDGQVDSDDVTEVMMNENYADVHAGD